MPHPKILLQFDTDSQPSSFDSVVAVDAGVDHLLQYAAVTPENVVSLVHGAMFTRGVDQLKNTALFVGGSDVAAGELLLKKIDEIFFGPIRVSVMLDSGGCNTTATAAVLSAARHVTLGGARATVLAATGPVGTIVCRLLAAQGCHVFAGSRSANRAEAVCERIREALPNAQIEPLETGDQWNRLPDETQVVIAAGAEGIELLPAKVRASATDLRVAIDLNAVPPLGIEGIEVQDRAKPDGDAICYGAIGVGGTKMKIHKAAIEALFASNDRVLDAEAIFALGRELEEAQG